VRRKFELSSNKKVLIEKNQLQTCNTIAFNFLQRFSSFEECQTSSMFVEFNIDGTLHWYWNCLLFEQKFDLETDKQKI
jgi:hypothetical protein